jgi:hypothetical protein
MIVDTLPNRSKPMTEMNEFIHQPALINVMTPLKTQTHKMVNFDPVLCYIVHGAVASLQDDIDKIHAQFKMALHTAGDEDLCWIVQLYATALNNICLPYEACDLLLEYQTLYPNEPSLLRSTIESCVHTGRVFQGEALLAHWHKLTDRANPYEMTIQQWANFYRHLGFVESEVQHLLETALSLVRQSLRKQRKSFSISTGYANYDGAPYLSYTLYINLPANDLLELEEQHNDLLLAGDFKESLLNNIIITFEHLVVAETAVI